MKKLILFTLLISMTIFFASCSKKDVSTGSQETFSTLSAGEVYKAGGVGDFTVCKVHTTDVIYSTLSGGTFVECEKEENTYIDVVFRFKNKKQAINSAELVSAVATGKNTQKKYTDFLVLAENDDNSSILPSREILPMEEITLHIAVEVPKESEDDIYSVGIFAGDDKFEFDYKLFEFVHNMESIYEGQTLSNSKTRAKLESCYYSTYLYDKAPRVCDAPDGFVYLVTKFKVMNKAFEERDVKSIISSHIRYEDKIFETNYLMSEKEDEDFVSGDKMPGLSEAYVISFCAVPEEYAAKDALIVFATDHKEFYTRVFGTDVFEERKVSFEEIETTAPIIQEDPVDDKEDPIEQEADTPEPIAPESESQEEPALQETTPNHEMTPEENAQEVITPENTGESIEETAE